MRAGSLSLTLVIVASSIAADAAVLELRVQPAKPAVGVVPLRIERMAGPDESATKSEPSQQVAVTVGGVAQVNLADGYYSVSAAQDSGYWSLPVFAQLRGEATTSLEMTVWKRGRITGRLAPTNQQIKDLAVEFESSPTSAPIQATSAPCVMNDREFSCSVPATRLNFKLRARGHVPLYFFGRQVPDDAPTSVGEIKFLPGQSIYGSVGGSFSRDRLAEVLVVATPTGGVASGAPQERRGAHLLPLTARPDNKGRFHIDGLRPGVYELRATLKPDSSSHSRLVTIADGKDAAVAEPLLVSRPVRLHLTITPASAPAESRWHVQFRRMTAVKQFEVAAEAAAGVDGSWTSPPVNAGAYEVAIGPSASDDVWWTKAVDIDQSDLDMSAAIDARVVHGMVSLGGKGLAAALAIYSPAGHVTHAQSSSEGIFEAVVPPESGNAQWLVQIHSSTPPIAATRQIDMSADSVKIELQKGSIAGRVVDVDDKPIEGAIISVLGPPAGQLAQFFSHPNGEFELWGLPPGKYQLSASAYLQESAPVQVDVAEDAFVDGVRIQVQKVRYVHGRVVSRYGPVANASISLIPRDGAMAMGASAVSDAIGEFDTLLKGDVRILDVEVAPPGFCFTIGRITLPEKKEVEAEVDERCGTITIFTDAIQRVTIQHNGALIYGTALVNDWHLAATRGGVSAAMMEPGPYRICDSGTAKCYDAIVPPGGESSFDLR